MPAFLTGNLWRAGAIALAVVALLLFVQVQLVQSERDKAIKKAGALTVQLETSNKSIVTLEGEISRMMQAALARQAELERSEKLAAQQAKQFDRAKAESNRRIERLNEIAADRSNECPVPVELLRELEGL